MIRASAMMLGASAQTPPINAQIFAILPVAEMKAEHRITHSAEDTRVSAAIEEAYFRLDGPMGWLNRAILTQTWVGYVNAFADEIEIPLPPLQAVTLIRYRDETGSWQTLSSSVYGIRSVGLFGAVYLKSGQSWPALHDEPASVEITFRAGWGDGASVLAAAIGLRKAMKLLAGHYFFNPTPTFVEPRLVEVPRKIQFGLEHVIGQYRIVNDHA